MPRTTVKIVEFVPAPVIRRQLQKGLAAAKKAAKKRGYKLHPKLQAKRDGKGV